jgi:hypothetical protein
MIRDVKLNVSELVGKKIYYDNHEVGHVVSIKDNEILCAIDSDIVAHRIKGGKASLSVEVIDK